MNQDRAGKNFIEKCSEHLIDLTNRNKLINFNFNTKARVRHFIEVAINNDHNSSSMLKIACYPAISNKDKKDNQAMNDGIDGSNEIFESKEYKNDILYKRFKKNYNKQEEIKKEKGFNSTFLVYGFFKYKDNIAERHAPIFLINCDIELVNNIYYKCVITKEFENCIFNYAIEEYFKQEFGIKIPSEITSNIDSFECIKDRILKLKEFLIGQKLNHQSDAIANIAIEDRFAISSFDSAKQSLYLEMQQHSDKIIAHHMIDFLLSDVNQDDGLNQDCENFERAESIDKNYKSDYFCNIFDCDGSQLEVIKAAKDGKSFIIQGPPGTGKTQTISNIIAELVYSGKKVLFVAEKKAAIDAVLRKFREIGLEKIFLDLHNKNTSSKNIVEQIGQSYEFFNKYLDASKVKFDFTRLSQLKDSIISRSDTLHKPLPIGKTTFDLIKSICEFKRLNTIEVNCEININTKDEYEGALSLLQHAKKHDEIYLDPENPWLNIIFNISSINADDSEVITSSLKDIESFCYKNTELKSTILNKSEQIRELDRFLSKQNSITFCKSSLSSKENHTIQSSLKDIETFCDKNTELKSTILNKSEQIRELEFAFFEYGLNLTLCTNEAADILHSLIAYLPTANAIDNPWLNVDFVHDVKSVNDLQSIDSLISNILICLKNLDLTLNSRIEITSQSLVQRFAKFFRSQELKKETKEKISDIASLKNKISFYFNCDINLQDCDIVPLKENILKIIKELEIKYSYVKTIIDVLEYKALFKKLEQFSLVKCWLNIKGSEHRVLDLINWIQNYCRLKQNLSTLHIQKAEFDAAIQKSFTTLDAFFHTESLQAEIRSDNLSQLKLLIEGEMDLLIESLNKYHNLKNEIQVHETEKQEIESKKDELFTTLDAFFHTESLQAEIRSDNLSQLKLLIQKADSIIQTLDYLGIVRSFKDVGMGSFWNEVIKNKISKNNIEDVFKNKLYSLILAKSLNQNYKLKNTASIKDDISEFKILDKNSIQANIDKFKNNFASKIYNKIDQKPQIAKLLNRQRFPQPRKLITDYRSEITSIAGCVVCSPLTICQYFDIEGTTSTIFDTVIFDEASQICTWDAVGSIIRATQLIVAGDREQMPPSNYFDSSFDIDEEEDGVEGYESLLDFLNTKLKSLPLVWHYRSKYEQLIAPSNKHVYKDKLITFPSSNKSINPMEFCYVENAIWNGGKNEIEARQVLKKLKELYQDGKRSVGVIAINCKQSDFIQEIVETDEDLLKWYLEDSNDGLFIKNLENCQGDERDIILISLTFAHDKDKKLSGTTFRQINSSGSDSYKKLNVMFTRAREKVYLFSSITSHNIPDKDSKAYRFLRDYIKCCESGSIDTLRQDREYDNFDSGFEEDVCERLRQDGYEVHSQIGCSGYKIDLAILCPINKDRYIIGIECDGEYYHKGKTAREKDRLRQDVLENKGWKIHRIWSYDWLVDKDNEVSKIKNLLPPTPCQSSR